LSILNREFGKRRAGSSGRSPQDQKLDDLRHLAGANAGLRTKSRLGGLPSLPDHIEWPRQTASGTPLHFRAQSDPSTPLDPAIDDVRLPSHGMLFFFADIEEEMLGLRYRGDQHAATRVNLPRRRGPGASLRRIYPRSVMRWVRWAAAIRGASRCFRQNPCRLT
jgi:Domain of unknown function (DUF1963)